MLRVWNKGTSVAVIRVGVEGARVNYSASPSSYVDIPDQYEDDVKASLDTNAYLSLDQVGGSVDASQIDQRSILCKFNDPIISIDVTQLLARVNTDAAQNCVLTADGKTWFTTNIGQQDAGPAADAKGLNIECDNTTSDGLEVSLSLGTAVKALNHFSNLSDSQFYCRHRMYLPDVSGTTALVMGFRKVEAHQAAFDNYADLAAMNSKAGVLNSELIVASAGTVETSMVETLDDLGTYDFLVVKDDVKALALGLLLANDIKSKYNTHIASVLAHTTAADTVNVITAADATTLATLLTLTNSITTDYVLHDDDAELGSGWAYHAAQETGSHSLAATTTVTTLIGALVRLNDAKTAIDAHIADVTAHGVATTAFAADLSSNYFFFYKLSTASAYTDVSVAGTLLPTDVTMMSTLQYIHAAHISEDMVLCEYEQGVGLPFGFENLGQD